jgi:gamma-glutamylcyclotransferase (GGCT)/AIG2-like uncharacterized protein YtfP
MVLGVTPAVFEGRMYILESNYPILVEREPAYPIIGEMLDLPDSTVVFQRIDLVEGVGDPGSPYNRVQRRILSDRGDQMAWLYIARKDCKEQIFEHSPEVLSGDWLAHLLSEEESGGPDGMQPRTGPHRMS